MMISASTLIFILGGLTFLFVFSWFKKGAIEVFKNELASNVDQKNVWSKLFQVFLVDWLLCILGVFGTGVVFLAIFNQLQ
jgi:flagellar biosynthesis protein FlhB